MWFNSLIHICNHHRFSGIIAQDLISVTTTLKDVQNDLLNLFYEDTILLGHSLESDLRSLKVAKLFSTWQNNILSIFYILK